MQRWPLSIISGAARFVLPHGGRNRRNPRRPKARMGALVLAATVAACASDGIQTTAPPAVLPADDPIPPPPDLADQIAALSAGWGFRLDPIPVGAPFPRVSAERATEVAGQELLSTLQANRMPPQNVLVPDGLLRRLYVEPQDGTRRSVWVVVYRWAQGFNCLGPQGGPGNCEAWSSTFVDDQTGEIVGGMSNAE